MNLTPVEALTLELNGFYEKKTALMNPGRAGMTIAVPLFEALLELAKADADYQAHYQPLDEGTCIWCLRFKLNLQTARTKLYEALQK